MNIAEAELRAVDLPFKHAFKHAAKARETSSSVFLCLRAEDGVEGWGECLPRPYVTGESQEGVFELLHKQVLPRLLGVEFESFDEVFGWLEDCDGKAPEDWFSRSVDQSAAWTTVDLALLDLAGCYWERPAFDPSTAPAHWRHSGVVSTGAGLEPYALAVAQSAMGLRHLKLKVDASTRPQQIRAFRWLTLGADLRVDANMGWTLEQALELMPALARNGVSSFEQPLPRESLEELAELVRTTGLEVMADESFSDRESLETLLELDACTAVNVRVSKCGGLVASLARCREAAAAGLTIQVGCQVGESSLLSAAQGALLERVPEVRYVEGAFGRRLLLEDPVRPVLEFGLGGRPPSRPKGPGLGCRVDRAILDRHSRRIERVSGSSVSGSLSD